MDRLLRTAASAALLCGAGAGAAAAACRPADLPGRWDVYITVPHEPTRIGWYRCPVRIQAGGGVARTVCALNGPLTRTITARLGVGSDCRVRGTVTFYLDDGAHETRLEATLTRSKDAMTGTVTKRSNWHARTFEAVRLPD